MILFMVSEVNADDDRIEIGLFDKRTEATAIARLCAEHPEEGVVGTEVEPFDCGENVYCVCDRYEIGDTAINEWHGDIVTL